MTHETKIEVRVIGRTLSVAIASVLFGSTMVLSAVGPVRASQAAVSAASQPTPVTVHALA